MAHPLSKLIVGKKRDTLLALYGRSGMSTEKLMGNTRAARELAAEFNHMVGLHVPAEALTVFIRREQKDGRWVATFRKPPERN